MSSANGTNVAHNEQFTVPTWVDNGPLSTGGLKTFPVINGKSGSTVHLASSANLDIVKAATDSSWKAFQEWRCSPLQKRQDLLTRFADVMEKRQDELVQCVVEETSSSPDTTKFLTQAAFSMVRGVATCVMAISGTALLSADDAHENIHGFVFKEAIGPVLLIPPWNAPVVLAARAIAQAVAAGCTVVMKSSELAPRSLYMVCEAFKEAGGPPGVLNSLQAMREDASMVTEALISNKYIRKVDFIGSANVGRIVASLAGKNLKPVMLELGGKCPALIMEDADLAQAAQLCVTGGLVHHGQMCVSTERIIVQEKVVQEFKSHLVKMVEAMSGIQGSAITKGIAQHAYDVVCDAQKGGHEFLTGKPEFLSPTSLAPAIVIAPKGSRMEDEETFGPSISLYTVKDEKEAIDLANDSSYGWSASIHTRDMDRAIKMAKQLDYGMVNCNNLNMFALPNAPTGGVKGTGWGRSNGMWGIDNFLVAKSFTYKAP